ncbi:MAG: ABC transporter ATP-binding protein [Bacteroidetes bacterium]|nr:ABC transporter ATP-binding protein [Bacteroidota bacterium]
MNLSKRIIEASGIYKSYFLGKSELRVLKGINFSIDEGEIIAIVGASGAGKSTLLHILGTLDRPTGGTVFYDSVDVFKLDDEKLAKFRSLQIGFVFQFHHLLPEFTAIENVAMPAMITGKKFSEIKGAATKLLGEVGLSERTEHRPSELSGGEQQRVAVARALINNPKVILADEPSGNLDSTNAETLHELLLALCRNHGTTFLIATHNDHLTSLAHRVMKIQDGVLVG